MEATATGPVTPGTGGRTVVELTDVSMSFGTVRVLQGVSMTVSEGSVLALIGANGAGKSTLIKILSGVYPDHGGDILVDGQKISVDTPRVARSLGIHTVHQKIADGVVPGLSVAENLVFDELTQSAFGPGFTMRKIMPRARQVAAELDLDWSDKVLRKDVFELGIADQQLLLLARALDQKPRMLVLDEPTSALSMAEVERLFTVIRGLKQSGVAILYVSHHLSEIDALADELVVLRDGRIRLMQHKPFAWGEALRAMLGDAVVAETTHEEQRGTEERLRLHGVRLFKEKPPQDIGFRSGEVTGIIGLLGAGKTELAGGIFGATPFAEGTMDLDGAPYHPKNPSHAVNKGVFLVPEDRSAEALLPGWTIARTAALPFLYNLAPRGFVPRGAEAKRGRWVIDQLDVVATGEQHKVDELSGGNQQRVVVGRWLAGKPKVLVLDEPFRGVDIGARAGIGRRLRALATEGCAVVITSSDVDEILEGSDRVLVLVDGQIRMDTYITETTRDQIIERMSEIA
ncbi:MAG TPA: sugar ABC transporter ATP-binding protein [Candidatus Limnocylindrales bacterium]|nr:sugar ABC transporter ATP-binding protein [Candidatus Limnocylindrales bacterium]